MSNTIWLRLLYMSYQQRHLGNLILKEFSTQKSYMQEFFEEFQEENFMKTRQKTHERTFKQYLYTVIQILPRLHELFPK